MSYAPTTWVEGVTKVGPTNLNHLETGLQASAVVADAAVAKPAAPATNAGLVWNGSAWVAALLVNGNIDPAANIVYSKLSLAGSIVNNDIASGAAVAYSKLSLTGGIVNTDVSASAAIAGSKLATGIAGPPGTELAYAEQTTDVSITATTQATANTIVTAGAVTFDGATIALISFSCFSLSKGTSWLRVVLYEDGVAVKDLGQFVGGPGYLAYRRTPASGSRTYSLRGYVDAGTGTVSATGFAPFHIRVSKV